MTVKVQDSRTADLLVRELSGARGGNGLLRFVVPLTAGGDAAIVIGRDYTLDGELAARIERIAGEGSVDLSAQEPPKLALVG
jgi:hypothetical protein